MLRLLVAPNVEAPVGLRDRAWLELAYSSGVRVGELIRLDLGDVDMSARTALLRETETGDQRVVPFGRRAAHWLGHSRPQGGSWVLSPEGEAAH